VWWSGAPSNSLPASLIISTKTSINPVTLLRRLGAASLLAIASLAIAAGTASALNVGVSGNHLAKASGHGKKLRLIGVNRSGSEYACASDDGAGGHGFGIFQGPVNNRAIKALKSWRVNAVALPLNEACWLGGYGGLKPEFTGDAYQSAIAGYVSRLNAHGIYVVLRLSGAGPGENVYGAVPGNAEIQMADADHALEFWSSLAARFSGNHGVLFQAYDEPHGISWDCALNGCATDADGTEGEPAFGPYQAVGHQAIVDTVRSTGATQPIIISGIDFAGDVSQWREFMPNDPQHSLVVNFDSFDYSGNLGSQKPFLRQLAHSFPVLVGGFGDTDCNSSFSLKLMKFADRASISYLAWTWNTEADYGGCENALLGPGESAYYSGHPSGYGKGVRTHFRTVQLRR
jgi:endoglucanase